MSFWDIFSILDKLLPNRKARIQNEINSLEKKLETALRERKDTAAAVVSERLHNLRKRIRNFDE